jgi:hypothetical protein
MLHGAPMLKFAGKPGGNFRGVLDHTVRALTSGLQPRNADR